jgi:hypothetical protein
MFLIDSGICSWWITILSIEENGWQTDGNHFNEEQAASVILEGTSALEHCHAN